MSVCDCVAGGNRILSHSLEKKILGTPYIGRWGVVLRFIGAKTNKFPPGTQFLTYNQVAHLQTAVEEGRTLGPHSDPHLSSPSPWGLRPRGAELLWISFLYLHILHQGLIVSLPVLCLCPCSPYREETLKWTSKCTSKSMQPDGPSLSFDYITLG